MTIDSFSGNYAPVQKQLQLAMGSIDPVLSDRISVVGVENVNGKKICKIKADLSNLDFLKRATAGNENSNNAEAADLIGKIVSLGSKLSLFGIAGLEIVELNLSHTNVSSRSVMGKFTWKSGEEEVKLVMPELLKSLTKLNLSDTQASDTIFLNLRYLALKELYLDDCSNMQGIPSSPGVLSETLEKISLVRALNIDPNFLHSIEKAFPNVRTLHCTQSYGPEAKSLGVKDAVTLTTAVEPVILNDCGHVIGREVVDKITECAFCKKEPQRNKRYFPAQFPVSQINKENGKWVAKVLDYARTPLEDDVNTYFHPLCHQLFTEKTCKALFKLDTVNTMVLKTLICPGCMELNQNLRNPLDAMQVHVELIPNDSFEESMQKSTLSELSDYSQRASVKKVVQQSQAISIPAQAAPTPSSAPTASQAPTFETREWASAIAQRVPRLSISPPKEAASQSSAPTQIQNTSHFASAPFTPEELAYPAQSLLGKVYQMIISQKEMGEIRRAIASLSKSDKKRILSQIDLQASIFDDPILLFNAVKKAILSKLQNAPAASQNALQQEVGNLVRLADILAELDIG